MSLWGWITGQSQKQERKQGVPATTTAGNTTLDATRTVTPRQRMQMTTYGPLATAMEQITEPLQGAQISVTVEGPGDPDEIVAELQEDISVTGRELAGKALLALWHGWSPIEVVWNPEGWTVAELRSPDPTGCQPVFEGGRLAGFSQPSSGAVLVNEEWLDALVPVYGSEYGEVPGHALIDRAWYHYTAHRRLTRLMGLNARNIALPLVRIGYPEQMGESGEENRPRALALAKGIDQSDDRPVVVLPQPSTPEEQGWAVELVEAADGAQHLIDLEARWLSRMYLALGVPSEMLVNESARGTQARTASVIDTFLRRLDQIANRLIEPALTRLLSEIVRLRHGDGWAVRASVETLDERARDRAYDLLTTAIQSRGGLAGALASGVDIAALCADAGVPYDPELVTPAEAPSDGPEEPDDEPEMGYIHPENIRLAAADGRGKEMMTAAKRLLPRLVTLIAGPRGEKGGLLVGLERAYRRAVESGGAVAWEPDVGPLVSLGEELRREARALAVKYLDDQNIEGYSGTLARADQWCQEHVETRTARLIQTMRDRATDHARAAAGRPKVEAAADKYWSDYVLARIKGDVKGYWEQLAAGMHGHYRSAPVNY